MATGFEPIFPTARNLPAEEDCVDPEYCFRLEDQIPANHLLRLIDCYVDFSFVREQPKLLKLGRSVFSPTDDSADSPARFRDSR